MYPGTPGKTAAAGLCRPVPACRLPCLLSFPSIVTGAKKRSRPGCLGEKGPEEQAPVLDW